MLGSYEHLQNLVKNSGMGTDPKEKPKRKSFPVNSFLAVILWFQIGPVGPSLFIFYASSSLVLVALLSNSRFLARKKEEEIREKRKEGEREGDKVGGSVSLFHVACHYSLRNMKLTKWI